MAPKRKDNDAPPTLPTRRSARNVAKETSYNEIDQDELKPVKAIKKGKGKKTAEKETVDEDATDAKEEEEAKEADPEEPAAKKSRTGIAVGDALPDLVLQDEDENKVKINELKNVIIFAYPKASTPGCTKQGCSFRDNYPKIQKAGYSVYGLSLDTPKSQKTFKTKQNFPYHLLSDAPNGDFLAWLGALKVGKKITRSHWIVDGEGKIEAIEAGVAPLDSSKKAMKTIKAEEEDEE
ncbi:thioredoxin peroxidase dot5 [Saitoella coloradoensis]